MNNGSQHALPPQGLDRPQGRFTDSAQMQVNVETCDVKTALLFKEAKLESFSAHIADLLGKKYPSNAAFAEPISRTEILRLREIINQMTGIVREKGPYRTKLADFLAKFSRESLSHLAIAAGACTTSNLLIDEAHRIMRAKE